MEFGFVEGDSTRIATAPLLPFCFAGIRTPRLLWRAGGILLLLYRGHGHGSRG